MSRRIPAVAAIVLVVATVALFVVGVTNHPGGLLGATDAAQALEQTFVVTLIASAVGCVAVITTIIAVGRRR